MKLIFYFFFLKNIIIKDSKYVSDRPSVPAGYNEVLLTDDDGFLMEGTSSNLFIIGPDGTYHTAEQGVLAGTVRTCVLKVIR